MVDSKPTTLKRHPTNQLELDSGLHRLDFDFGFVPEQPGGEVKLRCLFEGVDERWRDTELGMTLACQILGADDRVVSQSRFGAVGRSGGWESSVEESAMTRRTEPIYIPAGARKFRISLTSGSPDTTGFFAIDNIALHQPGAREAPLWKSGGYVYDAVTTSPAGVLPGWKRSGAEPAIAQIIMRPNHPALGLVDGDQSRDGEWYFVQDLPSAAFEGGTYVLSWDEVFNVIDGDTRRATYMNVPPGRYTFRAMGIAGDGATFGDALEVNLLIHPPFWQSLWFWPIVAGCVVGLVSGVIITVHRSRAKRSLERLRFQNALEKDRTRIARDMHDDLGTRVTFINMSAALAQKEMEISPANSRRHLEKVTRSARELVVAMDDLVWAVDPANDTLDDLASHIARLSEEMFRDSNVRCRLDIPPFLPALPLGAEFRHHVALSLKEALHNVLRHAGACEVSVGVAFDGSAFEITVRDSGRGFDLVNNPKGHGLENMTNRFAEIGGTCAIESSPGGGTSVVLSCPIAKRP
jgi:signal transduction histidine kinase